MSKFSQKTLILTLVIAVLVITGVALAYLQLKPQPNQNQNTNQPTNTNQGEEIDTSDLPSETLAQEGWKTYRNEEVGFEFKYPGEWGDLLITSKVGPDQYVSGQKVIFEFSNSSLGRSQGEPTPIVEIRTTDYIFGGPTDGEDVKFSRIDFSKPDSELVELLKRNSTVDLKIERHVVDGVQGLYIEELYRSLLDGEIRRFKYYVYPRYQKDSIFIIYVAGDISGELLNSLVSTLRFL